MLGPLLVKKFVWGGSMYYVLQVFNAFVSQIGSHGAFVFSVWSLLDFLELFHVFSNALHFQSRVGFSMCYGVQSVYLEFLLWRTPDFFQKNCCHYWLSLLLIEFSTLAIKILNFFHSLSYLILRRILKSRTNILSAPLQWSWLQPWKNSWLTEDLLVEI